MTPRRRLRPHPDRPGGHDLLVQRSPRRGCLRPPQLPLRGLDIDTAWGFDEVQELLHESDLLWNDVEEYRRGFVDDRSSDAAQPVLGPALDTREGAGDHGLDLGASTFLPTKGIFTLSSPT